MGIDVSPYEGPVIPVIYTINLRDPAGLFLASSFEMRNKDILYASNSVSVEVHQVHELSQYRQHDHSGTHHDRHERLWLAEYHPRHRRCAQHLRDRRNDHSRHVANALGLANRWMPQERQPPYRRVLRRRLHVQAQLETWRLALTNPADASSLRSS